MTDQTTDRPAPAATGRDDPATPGAPEFRVITTGDLVKWVRGAQPNARLPYGSGGIVAHACSAVVRDKVMELHDKGYLTPHRLTVAPGVVWQIVQRTHRPVLPGVVL